ncbi:MAG: AmmeMemoRadiSam system protein B, partial [Desulfobulbaceae bacterium]|nr:AmmeMemoRadiSam system protein B [Desulfobulbaceae bacterium]
MKKFRKQSLLSLSLLLVAGFLLIGPNMACGEEIRKPAWAGSFYPAARSDLKGMISSLTVKAGKTRFDPPAGKALKGLVLPHAGYIYSGYTAAHASLVLKKGQFKKVVLIGPDHRVGFVNGAIGDFDSYQTPFGLISLHPDAAKLKNRSTLFRVIPASDRTEHSLEVILPFLQYYLKEFQLVPVALGASKPEQIAAALLPMLDRETLLVISSDLSHFLSYEKAVSLDRETIAMILGLEVDKIVHSTNRACGKFPLAVLMMIAQKYGWQPQLLHYSNSGDTAGNRSGVVGYTAIAFYGDTIMKNTKNSVQQFNDDQGRILVKLARNTILERFDAEKARAIEKKMQPEMTDTGFQRQRGTFVTLKIGGQLRGCIGSLTATESVLASVKHNAINAAFQDPRFAPLTEDELEKVHIEVSILTDPEPMEYKDGLDLVAKLRANVDGVIIRKGFASATFLPQVWEQLPRPEDFLGRLCTKAGLPQDTWQHSKLDVEIYQVQYFNEGNYSDAPHL